MSSLWKFQYRRQFELLKETRNFLYRMMGLGLQKRVLEIGCSTALISEEISEKFDGIVVGLDKVFDLLISAKQREEKLLLVCADVYHLPFKRTIFDSVISQFFLLWLKDPFSGIEEMKKVLIPGGYIVSVAEPDYGGRIDFPISFKYPSLIVKKLLKEGADPFIGRKLEYIYRKSSLYNIQWGLASVPFGIELSCNNFEAEWNFIGLFANSKMQTKLKRIKETEKSLINEGKRAYFMPVFYCIGRKK